MKLFKKPVFVIFKFYPIVLVNLIYQMMFICSNDLSCQSLRALMNIFGFSQPRMAFTESLFRKSDIMGKMPDSGPITIPLNEISSIAKYGERISLYLLGVPSLSSPHSFRSRACITAIIGIIRCSR